MRREHVISKTTPVYRVAEILKTEPHLARPADSVYTLALRMARSPINRVACIVDPEKKLLGLIPLRVIVESLFYGTEDGFRTARKMGHAIENGEMLPSLKVALAYPEAPEPYLAETAGELMEAPIWIRPGDTVKDAVDKMLAGHLDGLPIVDGDMRVVGYIDMQELLRLWLGDTRPTAQASARP